MVVTVSTGAIVIRQECDPNDLPLEFCDKVWSRLNVVKISTFEEIHVIEDDDIDSNGTKSMGCGNSFKGGRCNDGSDPLNCVYKDASEPGAEKCIGLMHLVVIPELNTCND